MTRARVSFVSVSFVKRTNTKKNSTFHSIPLRASSIAAIARTRAHRASHPERNPRIVANIEKRAGKRRPSSVESHARRPSVAPVVPASSPRHRSSSSVLVPHPHPSPSSRRCVLVASSVVVPTSFATASRVAFTRAGDVESRRLGSVRSRVVFSTCPSERCVRFPCVRPNARARVLSIHTRDDRGAGFSRRFIHVCAFLSFLHSFIQQKQGPSHPSGGHVGHVVGQVETSRVGVDKRIDDERPGSGRVERFRCATTTTTYYPLRRSGGRADDDDDARNDADARRIPTDPRARPAGGSAGGDDGCATATATARERFENAMTACAHAISIGLVFFAGTRASSGGAKSVKKKRGGGGHGLDGPERFGARA